MFLIIYVLQFLILNFAHAEDVILTPSDSVPSTVQKVFEPKYQTGAEYGLTSLENGSLSHSAQFSFESIQNEFSQPGLKLDFLSRYTKKEAKFTAFHFLKNKKKQWLKLNLSGAPDAKIFPRWNGEIIGASAVYGKPIELSMGLKFNSYAEANTFQITPGLTAYFDYGWVLTANVFGSKAKTQTIKETKWLMGYGAKLQRFYENDSSYSLFFSKNEECEFNPNVLQYDIISVLTTNLTVRHWINESTALQPEFEFQEKNLINFKNWITARASFVFKI